VLRVLRGRVSKDRESRDGREQLLCTLIPPKLADGGANAALIALEQRFVEVYFFPFFFAGAFVAGFFAVVVEALAIPSDSERLSSTSTVCVIASVPLVSGPDG